MRVSYHTHSEYCDGCCQLEDYVLKAIEKQFGAMGFSSHSPLPFETDWALRAEDLPDYLNKAYLLQEKYKKKIQLYVGLEIDYIHGIDVEIPEGIEYSISSVHYVHHIKGDRLIPVDGPFELVEDALKDCYQGDGKAYTMDYYSVMKEMTIARKPQMVGHLDLLKKSNKNNMLFDEGDSWYKDEIEQVLKVIKDAGSIMEINTGGLSRKYVETCYPSPWIIEIMKEMDIPIVLNSDAHNPAWLDTEYGTMEQMLKKIGYVNQRVLYDGIWQDVPIG